MDSGWRETIKIIVHAPHPGDDRAHLLLSALQHPFGLDEVDAAGRRLPVRVQAVLRLQPLLLPVGHHPLQAAASSPPSPSAATWSVFKLPRDNSTDFIKRVIGLPGDEIAMRGGVLYINGQAVPKVRKGDFISPEERPADPALRGDAAQRRQVPRARRRAQRPVRQRRTVQGAAWPLLHDGRQPRQLHRQPRAVAALRRRLRALREPGGTRRDHLLLGRRRRSRTPSG